MQKTLLLFFLSLLLSGGALSAREVTAEQARQTATRFWQSTPKTRGEAAPSWQLVRDSESAATRSSGAAPAYYVFDNTAGPGFVIVAGDDVAMPVLGYSFDSEFPSGTLPPNLQAWLDGLRETVNKARAAGWKAESHVTQAWASTRGSTPVVKLETALWNQDDPYNRLCPTYQGSPTYTGCTTTALTIVMHYHQWPERGTGSLPSYTTKSYGIPVPGFALGHAYDWANMKPKYAYTYQGNASDYEYTYTAFTETEATAVATLMRDCAVMLQSDFGPDGTGAYTSDIPNRLIDHMGYDRQTRWLYRPNYSTAEWNRIMQDELNNDRPIIYSGYNAQAGHAFVLDGYTNDNYYSVNWGWGGYCNGYFLLTALDPEGQGIGGSDHYNNDQIAVVGMQPDAGNSAYEELRFVEYTDPETGRTYKGITVEGNIAQGETIQIYAGLICNYGNLPFSGEMKVAVTDQDNRIIRDIYTQQIRDLGVNYGYNVYCSLNINFTLRPGYRIRTLYRNDTATEWSIVRGNDEEGCIWDCPIADESTIETSTSLTYNKTERMMRLQVMEGVTATLQASDGTDYSSLCRADGQEIRIDTSTLPGDTYLLILQKDTERKELLIALPDNE